MIVVPGRVISAKCILNCLNPGIKFFPRRISKFQRENEKFGVRVVVRTSFGKLLDTSILAACAALQYCCFLFQPLIVMICGVVRVVAFAVVVSETANY